MLRKRIYLDYAAGSSPNASAAHSDGVKSRERLEEARKKIAQVLGVRSDEIIFTSGGTEGNNLALFGLLKRGDHVITTSFEHQSILKPLEVLEGRGVKVTYIRPDENGIINPRDVERAVCPNTRLASIIYVQNEIGTVEDLREIRKAIGKDILLHTDACQALGLLPIKPNELGVDLMTFNGHKIYAPQGTGFLYIKRGISLSPLFFGGGQERGLRSGTENVDGSVALAEAVFIAEKNRQKESVRLKTLRDYFIDRILKEIPDSFLNGDRTRRIANNINISFLEVESEYLLLALDSEGVAVSAGSACVSGYGDSSYVIMSINSDHRFAESAVRFTMGRKTKKSELDYVFKKLKKIVTQARWKI